jgi:hypothetical protein
LQEKKMKIVKTIAELILLASPAFAASAKHAAHQAAASESYAAYPMQDSYTVIENGQYAGRDPDPSVRLSLQRDPGLQAN